MVLVTFLLVADLNCAEDEGTKGGDMGNSRRCWVPVGILIAFVVAIRFVNVRTTAASADVYDVVVLSGRVIDPESGLDAVRNVGISGQTIKVITSEPITGKRTIDAKGLVVAPGFIDLHQHDNEPSDYALNVMDGVTSALELETGTADVDAWYAKRAGKALINFGVSAGHLPARVAVMGDPGGDYPSGDAAHRSATEKEIGDIKALLVRGLERGAVAVGTRPGLTPGASNWEMLEVFACVRT